MSGADVGPRLRDAAGAPRYEVPVDELYGRARRARRRNLAVAGGAAGLLVVIVAVLVALLPANDPAPIIGPGPERNEPTDDPTDDPASPAPEPTEEGTGEASDADASPLAADWVVNDLDGLRDHEGQPIWDTEGIPAPTTARDGDGGLVFTDAEGLWWWPATATEPERVREGPVGSVVEVTTADGDRIARTTEAGDLRLADGTEADADLGTLLEPTPEGAAITAANGLSAEVVAPEVERTPEGMIEQVIEPTRVVISRDGEPELEVVVGTEHEPLARLHDFDGRRVLLSRFPEEPAMAPETVVALDLDCSDCVTTLATSSPGSASLIGTDLAWDGPVQAPQQDLVTPMTTDEDLQALPDGRHLRTGLWWVTIEDGRAVGLDEQYVP